MPISSRFLTRTLKTAPRLSLSSHPHHLLKQTIFQSPLSTITAPFTTTTHQLSTMATAHKIHLTKSMTGLLDLPQTEEVAAKVSELLQRDMERHHVFFNASGFHNHIVHHLLALFSTSSPLPKITSSYQENAFYQLPSHPPNPTIVSVLGTLAGRHPYLGKGKHYNDFLSYFQAQISLHGRDHVLKTELFDTEGEGEQAKMAEDLIIRLHSGVLHPLLHLMYGLEFSQPAIVAQALAQAAVHGDEPMRGYLLGVEGIARDNINIGNNGNNNGETSIEALFQEVRATEKLATSARFTDEQKIGDGVLTRARDEMMELAARVRVGEGREEIEAMVGEMYEMCVLMGMGAMGAGGRGRKGKVDFFFMHHINSAPFYLSLLSLPATTISPSTKARMVTWKIRLDLLQYAARGAPELVFPPNISSVLPSSPNAASQSTPSLSPSNMFTRLATLKTEDGHAIKLGRAVEILRHIHINPTSHPEAEEKYGGKYEEKYEEKPWIKFRTSGSDWDVLRKLVLESTELTAPGEARWVRSCGFSEAWGGVPEVK